MMPSTPVCVSLIVPTYNESMNIQELIRRAHRALRRVTGGFEILVVDDRSSDGTAELVGCRIEATTELGGSRVEPAGQTASLGRSG